MGREVRMVPADWEHPKNEHGNYIPLHGRSFKAERDEWDAGKHQWDAGMRWNYGAGKFVAKDDDMTYPYEEWAGGRPESEDYMPDWPESERTHLMMYEDVSEGTPISPAFENAEDLARWLADNNASACGSETATYEQWLATINQGGALSMVVVDGHVMSGVEFATE